MQRFECHPQQFVSQRQEEYFHNQHAQSQQFDSALRDKDEVIQSSKQEQAINKEQCIQELEALQDAERRVQQPSPVFAAASTQPYATQVEKKTLHVVANQDSASSLAESSLLAWDWCEGECARKGHLPSLNPSLSFQQAQEEYQIQHNQEEEQILLVVAHQDLVIVHLHHRRDFLFSKLQKVHQDVEEA